LFCHFNFRLCPSLVCQQYTTSQRSRTTETCSWWRTAFRSSLTASRPLRSLTRGRGPSGGIERSAHVAWLRFHRQTQWGQRLPRRVRSRTDAFHSWSRWQRQ
jgi:hypothetical protein